jgi:hypothetical protein
MRLSPDAPSFGDCYAFESRYALQRSLEGVVFRCREVEKSNTRQKYRGGYSVIERAKLAVVERARLGVWLFPD